jgi:phosphatidylinositol alpha-1,6-mannosyltransferase
LPQALSALVDSSSRSIPETELGVGRVIVLTPMMGGVDGISEMTRQWVGVIESRVGGGVGTVEVWSLADDSQPVTLASETTFHTARGSRLRFAAFAIRRGIASAADTLVIVMHLQLLPVALPLVWRGARLVTVLMGIEAWTPLRLLEKVALRRAWKVVAISGETAVRFRAANRSLTATSITVCHPGAPMMPPADPERINGPYALIVGRMSSRERYKGHDALIDMWPLVRKSVSGAQLIVAGDGDDAGRLRAKAGDGITFVGRVDKRRLAALYRDATFFVMPSTDEGFGLVYLEAMRASTPCIAARGAAEEIISDGRDGLIVDAGDRDGLVAAMVRLFVDRDTRTRMAAAATRRVDGEFGRTALERRICDALALP